MEFKNTAIIKDGKIATNNIEIYYKYYFQNENTSNLVMMSGLTRDHQIWGDENIAKLTKAFNVLVFDNRGTGRSSNSKNQYGIDTLADDVIGLLDALDIKKTRK